MIETDLLFIFAEIGVALAGFSAIIGVLSYRPGASDVRVDALRLQVMLETSLLVAAVAIIPVLLDSFGIASNALWVRFVNATLTLSSQPVRPG